MKATTLLPTSEASIWERIVEPENGALSQKTAQAILGLDFNAADQRRMAELAGKASDGTLTPRERKEAEAYNRVAHLLALLQSKARQSLRARKQH